MVIELRCTTFARRRGVGEWGSGGVGDAAASSEMDPTRGSDSNALDLVQGQFVVGAVVELGGAGRFVRGNLLGLLDGAAVLQVRRDAGRAEGVATRRGRDPGVEGAPLDHAQDIGPAHAPLGAAAALALQRSEQGRALGIAVPAGLEVGVEVSMLSRSLRASSASRTGVLPRLTT